MWIFTPSHGFVSVVQHRDDPDTLIVRARKKHHLARWFPMAREHITHTPHADYAYRIEVPRQLFAERMAGEVMQMDHDNFKAAVTKKDPDDTPYHRALLDIWSAMWTYQTEENPK